MRFLPFIFLTTRKVTLIIGTTDSKTVPLSTLQEAITKSKDIVGYPMKRVEDPRLVTGEGRYLDDIRLPDTLYGVFVRAAYAHAKIKGIGLSAVQHDVALVLTARDFKHVKNMPTTGNDSEKTDSPRPVLAIDEVNYLGEAIALVVAKDLYAAEDAAELVMVDYEPLEAVEDLEKALKPNAARTHDYLSNNIAYHSKYESGDVDKVFEEADEKISLEITNQRVAPLPMEPRGVVASFDVGARSLTVWLSTQDPHGARSLIADTLDLPENKVRVIAPDVGGGFGAKAALYPEEIVVAYASMRLGRSIKWVETRSENLLSMTHGRGQKQYIEAAVSRDGLVRGLKIKIVSDCGAYNTSTGWSNPSSTMQLAPGQYDLAAFRSEVLHVFTNKVPQDSYRGAGRPEANYLIERTIHTIARKLKFDPVRLRTSNYVRRDKFPYKTMTGLSYDSGDYERNLLEALKVSEYEKLRTMQRRAREDGRLVGIGLASWVDITGTGAQSPQTAAISITSTGKATVAIGGEPQGQGHATSAVQITAQVLGIDPADIDVKYGDTNSLVFGFVTGGSSGSSGTGSAVFVCANKVKKKMSEIAASMLNTDDELSFQDGKIFVSKTPQKFVTFLDVARTAYRPDKLPKGMEATLFEYTAFAPTDFIYPFGAHVAAVEVDKETGVVKLLKYFAVDDCGKVINPLIVEGQVHGGVLQGIGQALLEQIVYNESGQLLTATLADYLLPVAETLPHIECGRTETPTSRNPLGIKGIGEGPTIAATTVVVNAVDDALSPLGVFVDKMPLAPDYILGLMKSV